MEQKSEHNIKTNRMENIKYLNKNTEHILSGKLSRIKEESAQEDLDEKVRKNIRFAKWDDLLYNVIRAIALVLFLVVFGIIELPPSLNSAIGAGGITTILVSVFRFIYKQNSS